MTQTRLPLSFGESRQKSALRHLLNIALDVEIYLDDQPILNDDEEALLEGVRFAIDKAKAEGVYLPSVT